MNIRRFSSSLLATHGRRLEFSVCARDSHVYRSENMNGRDEDEKGLLWKLPVVKSRQLGKLGPAFGVGSIHTVEASATLKISSVELWKEKLQQSIFSKDHDEGTCVKVQRYVVWSTKGLSQFQQTCWRVLVLMDSPKY